MLYARATNSQRKQARTTLFWTALCLVWLFVLASVVTVYFTVIKPHYLTKVSTSSNKRHIASWYGSKDHLLKNPSGLAFTPSGNLYVADSAAGEIVAFDRYGQRTHAFGGSNLSVPTSVACARNGRIYVVDGRKHQLLIFNKQEKLERRIAFKEATPQAVAVGPSTNNGPRDDEALYVVFRNGVIKGTLEGEFSRAFFTDKKAGGLQGLSAMSVVEGKVAGNFGTSPRMILSDTLGKRVVALDSFDASPTIAWDIAVGDLPAGVATAEGEVYYAEGLSGKVRSADVETGVVKSTIATYGTSDGWVAQPRALAINRGQLYLADAGNSRVSIFSLEGERATRVEAVSPLMKYGLLALCVLLGSGALACFIARSFVRPRRYLVDFSVAEVLAQRYYRHPLEQVADRIHYIADLSEWVEPALQGSVLKSAVTQPTKKLVEKVKQAYPDFDSFDTLTLASACTHGFTLVTIDETLMRAARAFGVETTSPSELAHLYRQEHEEFEFITDEKGFISLRFLSSVAIGTLTVVFLAVLMWVSCAHANQPQVEVVSLASLTYPQGTAPDTSTFTSSFGPQSHKAWESTCSDCHTSTLDTSSLEHSAKTTCEYCHAGSSVGGDYMTYGANGGDASNFGEGVSGHQNGLVDRTPLAGDSKISELNCYSCHKTHATDVKSALVDCQTCHTKARPTEEEVASYAESKAKATNASDEFELTTSVRAHSLLQNDQSGFLAHSAAGITCATCHRGNLSADGSCAACHYRTSDFEKDAMRAAKLSDWPHSSSNDTALLGSWTTVASGKDLGKKVALKGGMTLENQTRVFCGRCHPTKDGKNFVQSMHALKHDPVRSGLAPYITSTPASSTVQAISTGYISGGTTAQASPFASPYEFGPKDGSLDDVPCSLCHFSDVKTEHALHTTKSCAVCHTKVKADGTTDWTALPQGVTAQTLVSCGTSEAACHKDNWHGNDSERFLAAHRVVSDQNQPLTSSSCAGDASGLQCHGRSSAQSLFKFGALDLASAHNDYWVAQKQNFSTNTLYTETISSIDTLRGCGLCHDKQTTVINGVAQKQKALSSGRSFDCSSCHDNQTAVYAENSCYKAPAWKAPTMLAARQKVAEDTLTSEAKQYLKDLAQQKSTGEVTSDSGQSITSKLKAGASDDMLQSIPPSMLPLTRPMDPNSPFSLIRGYLAPYPSIMNGSDARWRNL